MKKKACTLRGVPVLVFGPHKRRFHFFKAGSYASTVLTLRVLRLIETRRIIYTTYIRKTLPSLLWKEIYLIRPDPVLVFGSRKAFS